MIFRRKEFRQLQRGFLAICMSVLLVGGSVPAVAFADDDQGEDYLVEVAAENLKGSADGSILVNLKPGYLPSTKQSAFDGAGVTDIQLIKTQNNAVDICLASTQLKFFGGEATVPKALRYWCIGALLGNGR